MLFLTNCKSEILEVLICVKPGYLVDPRIFLFKCQHYFIEKRNHIHNIYKCTIR